MLRHQVVCVPVARRILETVENGRLLGSWGRCYATVCVPVAQKVGKSPVWEESVPVAQKAAVCQWGKSCVKKARHFVAKPFVCVCPWHKEKVVAILVRKATPVAIGCSSVRARGTVEKTPSLGVKSEKSVSARDQ